MSWWIIVLALLTDPLAAQDHTHGTPPAERLGTVNFQNSCSAAAQQPFNRAVALLHSFDFSRAVDAFNTALKTDPSCAIAHWGIALSRWGNPFAAGLKPASQLDLGLSAIAAARSAAAKTERERAYIDAAAHLYTDHGRIPQAERARAYRDAIRTPRKCTADAQQGCRGEHRIQRNQCVVPCERRPDPDQPGEVADTPQKPGPRPDSLRGARPNGAQRRPP